MTQKSNDDIAALPRIELVFQHRVLTADGKLLYAWAEGTDGTGKMHYYSGRRNIAPHASPGNCYSFPHVNGSEVYGGQFARFVRAIDGERLTEWAAKDRATWLEILRLREEKKAGSNDALIDALAPLREAYFRVKPQQRQQLLAWMVEHITNPSR